LARQISALAGVPRHEHAAVSPGASLRFASRQQNVLARPVGMTAAFEKRRSVDVLQTGCRVPQVAKEPRTTRRLEDTMNADELKKLTATALDQLRAALEEGYSERLTGLLKMMARFHRYSVNNVCRLCRARHNRHHADSRIMPRPCSIDHAFRALDGIGSLVSAA
jgi:hypothetical protein